MANNAIITVNDGESTPVAHVFSPLGIVADTAKYQNKAEAFFAGRETLQLRMKSSGKVRTVSVTLRVPRIVDETINGVTAKRVVDFGSANLEILVPLTWDAQDSENLRVIASNILQNVAVGLMVDEGEFVW